MAKRIVVGKICSCQFVGGLAPTGSSLNSVWGVTETGSQQGNGHVTFNEVCDTHVQHGSLVTPSFPAEIGVCCEVMLALVCVQGCCALLLTSPGVKLWEQLPESPMVVLQRGIDAS